MSQVAISGNASGTGTLTIAAPNTNSNYTLTLPAATGTVASIASVNNNGVVYANSSGQPTTGTAFVFDGTNVGIGTSSPARKLVVASSSAMKLATAQGALFSDTANDGGVIIGSDFAIGSIQATNAAGTSAKNLMLQAEGGNLLVGTTSTIGSATGVLQVKGAASQNAMQLQIGTNGNNGILWYNASASAIGSIVVNSGSVAYNTTSDYRLKENIAPMTGALEKVSVLKPVTYTWKATGESTQGFIAHELQEVCPDAVSGKKDAVDADGNPVYQGIDTSFLVATLTAAIQELKALVDTQASTITQLQADVAELKGATP